jgi:hypothetical protein
MKPYLVLAAFSLTTFFGYSQTNVPYKNPKLSVDERVIKCCKQRCPDGKIGSEVNLKI